MASLHASLPIRRVERRLISVHDFEDYEHNSQVADSLIKAHKETMSKGPGWTNDDDMELRSYIDADLHKDPRSFKGPSNHPLYRRMNDGPEYITRAAVLFVNAVLTNKAYLAAFDRAAEDYGFAAPEPAGLLSSSSTHPGTFNHKKRAPLKGWWGGKITVVYDHVVKSFPSSATQQPTESTECSITVNPYTHRDRGMASSEPAATQRNPPQPFQFEGPSEPMVSETTIPAKRHLSMGLVAYNSNRSAVGLSSKKSRLDLFAQSESGEGSQLPDLRDLNVNRPAPKKMEQEIAQMKHDFNKLEETCRVIDKSLGGIATGAVRQLQQSHQDLAEQMGGLIERIAALETTVTQNKEEALRFEEMCLGQINKLNGRVGGTESWCKTLYQSLKDDDTRS